MGDIRLAVGDSCLAGAGNHLAEEGIVGRILVEEDIGVVPAEGRHIAVEVDRLQRGLGCRMSPKLHDHRARHRLVHPSPCVLQLTYVS